MKKGALYLIGMYLLMASYSAHAQTKVSVKSNNETIQHVIGKLENQKYVHSIGVAYRNKVVSEVYFNGNDKKTKHNLRSITQIATSILTGRLLEMHLISELDDKIAKYYPEYISPYDKLTNQIEIRHLLTMSSGFLYYEGLDDEIFNYSDDHIKTILNLNFLALPGDTFNYCSPNYHLLSGIINKASHKSVDDFAKQHLFKPLGIKNWTWEKDPKGNNYGAKDLFLTQQDILKIGCLYTHDGMYKKKHIIGHGFVEMSMTNQFEPFEGGPQGYSFGWHIDNERKIAVSIGYGGQLLIISREKELVISVMCNDKVSQESHGRHLSFLIDNVVDPILNAL